MPIGNNGPPDDDKNKQTDPRKKAKTLIRQKLLGQGMSAKADATQVIPEMMEGQGTSLEGGVMSVLKDIGGAIGSFPERSRKTLRDFGRTARMGLRHGEVAPMSPKENLNMLTTFLDASDVLTAGATTAATSVGREAVEEAVQSATREAVEETATREAVEETATREAVEETATRETAEETAEETAQETTDEPVVTPDEIRLSFMYTSRASANNPLQVRSTELLDHTNFSTDDIRNLNNRLEAANVQTIEEAIQVIDDQRLRNMSETVENASPTRQEEEAMELARKTSDEEAGQQAAQETTEETAEQSAEDPVTADEIEAAFTANTRVNPNETMRVLTNAVDPDGSDASRALDIDDQLRRANAQSPEEAVEVLDESTLQDMRAAVRGEGTQETTEETTEETAENAFATSFDEMFEESRYGGNVRVPLDAPEMRKRKILSINDRLFKAGADSPEEARQVLLAGDIRKIEDAVGKPRKSNPPDPIKYITGSNKESIERDIRRAVDTQDEEPIRITGANIDTSGDNSGEGLEAFQSLLKREGIEMDIGKLNLSADSSPLINAMILRQNSKALREVGTPRFETTSMSLSSRLLNSMGKRSANETTDRLKDQYLKLLDQGFFPDEQEGRIRRMIGDLDPGQYIKFRFDKNFGLIPAGIAVGGAAASNSNQN